ncbi:MAG TPA: hypothetical protein VFF28_06380 [Candidatus Nanoarchaeia archaeon]|nr:hypothetical protein [Candidatus Nanoarchaeia archaeon]
MTYKQLRDSSNLKFFHRRHTIDTTIMALSAAVGGFLTHAGFAARDSAKTLLKLSTFISSPEAEQFIKKASGEYVISYIAWGMALVAYGLAVVEYKKVIDNPIEYINDTEGYLLRKRKE